MPSDVAEDGEDVVEREAGGNLPYWKSLSFIDRPRERERLHEMGRQPQQTSSLGTGLEYEVQMSVLEVSHTAMHEPRRPAGRSAREIALVDQPDRQAAHGGVAYDAGPRDSAADDERVEDASRERLELARARVHR